MDLAATQVHLCAGTTKPPCLDQTWINLSDHKLLLHPNKYEGAEGLTPLWFPRAVSRSINNLALVIFGLLSSH